MQLTWAGKLHFLYGLIFYSDTGAILLSISGFSDDFTLRKIVLLSALKANTVWLVPSIVNMELSFVSSVAGNTTLIKDNFASV